MYKRRVIRSIFLWCPYKSLKHRDIATLIKRINGLGVAFMRVPVNCDFTFQINYEFDSGQRGSEIVNGLDEMNQLVDDFYNEKIEDLFEDCIRQYG